MLGAGSASRIGMPITSIRIGFAWDRNHPRLFYQASAPISAASSSAPATTVLMASPSRSGGYPKCSRPRATGACGSAALLPRFCLGACEPTWSMSCRVSCRLPIVFDFQPWIVLQVSRARGVLVNIERHFAFRIRRKAECGITRCILALVATKVEAKASRILL